MRRPSFSINQQVMLHDVKCRISKVVDDCYWLEPAKGVTLTRSLGELTTAFSDGSLVFPDNHPAHGNSADAQRVGRQLEDFSGPAQRVARYRRELIREILKSGPIVLDRAGIMQERVAAAHAILAKSSKWCEMNTRVPHAITVWRWQRYLAADSDAIAFVPAFENRGGRGKRRVPQEQDDLERGIIQEVYLEQRGVVQDVVDRINKEIEQLNEYRPPAQHLREVSHSTIYRAIKRLDPYEVVAMRHGEKEATRRFRGNRTVPLATRPLEIVEIDETPLDLFVIDDEHGLPLGRPYFTAGIDRYSGMPWGMAIHFQDPSAVTMLKCIAHGIKPKHYMRHRFPDVVGDWSVYGIPVSLRCDNARWYHSAALAEAAKSLGFNLEFCPSRRPNWKSRIENFMKKVNYNFAHTLPGTSLAKYFQRKDYDPLKVAVIDLSKLHELLHRWVVDDLMNTQRRRSGFTPLELWTRAVH